MIDFSKYSVAEELLKQSNMIDKIDRVRWTGTISRQDTAIKLAEMLIQAKQAYQTIVHYESVQKLRPTIIIQL